MFKKQLVTIIIMFVLSLTVTGAFGVIADSLGLTITPAVQACNGQGSGGGC